MHEHRADYAQRNIGLVRTLIFAYMVLLTLVIALTRGRPYGEALDQIDYTAFAVQYLVLASCYGLTFTRIWPRVHHPAGTLVVLIVGIGSLIPYRTASAGIYESQFVATSSIAILGMFALARLPWNWVVAAASIVTAYAAWFVYKVRPLPAGSTPWVSWAFAYMLGFIVCRMGERSDEQLFAARAKVDALLDSVYPKSVADRLRAGERKIADEIPEAAVMMLDLANFSEYSRERSAAVVVEELNRLFGIFDERAEEFKVTKIKTSGDLYMAIATGEDAAPRLARFALAVADEARKSWNFRIGLHVGSVVAGVVGDLRSLYDVWGTAVNTAARLEQTGERGRIQISEEFAERIPGFQLEERGMVELKGIGSKRTFWLLSEGR